MMSYWVLFIGIAVVSWLVQMNLQNKFKKYSKIPTGNGMTGRDVALKMLHDNGIYDAEYIPSVIVGRYYIVCHDYIVQLYHLAGGNQCK